MRGLRPAGRSGDRHHGPRGQALVEFALVAPIMALIFAALVQLAFIYERQIGIENAVRDAARRAATFDTTDSTEAGTNGQFVWNLLTSDMLPNNVQAYDSSKLISGTPTVCYRTATDASGVSQVLVKVSVTYAHPLFLPLIAQILDGIDGTTDSALHVSTSSEFAVQNDPGTGSSVGGTPVGWPGGSC